MPHPISRLANRDIGASSEWGDYLAQNFEGQENLFWKHLIDYPAKRPFVVFCDSELFHRLQLSYWRNIFAEPTAQTLFDLYNYYRLDSQLKSHLLHMRRGKILKETFGYYPERSFEDFSLSYDAAESISALLWLDKGMVSFEYLLAHYAVEPDSAYGKSLIAKVRSLAWKRWFNDIESLKSELLNCALDWSKMFPDLKEGLALIPELTTLLDTDPRFRWITDEDFNGDNLRYLLGTYPKQVFLDIIQKRDNVAQTVGIVAPNGKIERREFVNLDVVEQTNCLFDNEIERLLDYDVNRGFGCIFVADQLQSRSNQVFASLLYSAIRNRKLEELARFRLK